MPNEQYYYATGSEVTSIADAIRRKGGTSEQLVFPDDFVEAIDNISGSSGSSGGVYQDSDGYIVLSPTDEAIRTPVDEKDVNFLDYDGMILYSYTVSEFANLSALPALPTHTGRTGIGWNWTLAQINTQLTNCPGSTVWVGAKFKSSDGKTHLLYEIPDSTPSNRLTVYLRYTQSVAYGVTVDWGDNSEPESHSTTSAARYSHTYAAPGKYDVAVTVTDGTVSFIGGDYNTIFGDTSWYFNAVRLKSVVFGDNVLEIGNQTFYGWYGGDNIYVPTISSTNSTYEFANNGTKTIIVDDSNTFVPESFCRYDFYLRNISLPSGITEIRRNAFYECYLAKITIPYSVTTIGESAFYANRSAVKFVIPAGVTSIGASAFYRCYSAAEYHFLPTTPPTLGSDAFNGIPSDCIIYVPYSADHSILNAYQTADNWSEYATYMQEEPQ